MVGCSENRGFWDAFGDSNMPALSAAESHSGTDVPTNNANERKRPPLDAGDLSQPYSKPRRSDLGRLLPRAFSPPQ